MKFSGEQRRTAFLLISPAVIVLLAINLFPIVYAVYISFHHWTLARPQPPRLAGWFNYEEALTDDRFINAIWVSLSFVALAVAVEFILGFLLAFVFHARLRGLATLRKISMLPVMVMPLVLGRGKKLFGDGTMPAVLKLVSSQVSTSGVIVANYERAGEVQTGSFAMETPTEAELERRRNLG